MSHLITPSSLDGGTLSLAEYYAMPGVRDGDYTEVAESPPVQRCCGYFRPQEGYSPQLLRMSAPLFGRTNLTSGAVYGNPGYGGAFSPPGSKLRLGVANFGEDVNGNKVTDRTSQAIGVVQFAVCCSGYLTLRLSGVISGFYDGVDSLTIQVNGSTVYTKSSSIAEFLAANPGFDLHDHDAEDVNYWASVTYGHFETVVLTLPQSACNDIVTITADSVSPPSDPYDPDRPDAYWRASSWQVDIISIT